MKAVRLVQFSVRNEKGDVKIVRIDKNDIVRVATALKKGGYRIIRDSFSMSDTIVINNTTIIKNGVIRKEVTAVNIKKAA